MVEHKDYKLKPCPFCGGIAQENSNGGCNSFTVFCRECGAKIVDHYGTNNSEVIKQWNRRT